MTDGLRAVPIGEAAAKDPAVQELVDKIARGAVNLSTPVTHRQPTEDDLRRLDVVLDRIFGTGPTDKG